MTKIFYYWPPVNPRFYFPVFKGNTYPYNEYVPYSILSKIIWWFWRHIKLIRQIKTIEYEKVKYLINIKYLTKINSPFIVYVGSENNKKKVTFLTINNKKIDRVIKITDSVDLFSNYENEIQALKTISTLEFVPKLIQFKIDKDYIMIETDYCEYKTLTNALLTVELIKIILKVNSIKIIKKDTKNTEIWTFSHGDFCPWNIKYGDQKYYIFDWEKSGLKPAGYDLFTYILQFNYLIKGERNFKKMFDKYSSFLNYYFSYYSIQDYWTYFISFLELKCDLEKNKTDQTLFNFYNIILQSEK